MKDKNVHIGASLLKTPCSSYETEHVELLADKFSVNEEIKFLQPISFHFDLLLHRSQASDSSALFLVGGPPSIKE